MTALNQTTDFHIHTPPAELSEQLDPLVEGLLAEKRVPGLALALVRDGEVIWSRGWGRTHAAAGESMTAQSRLEAASLAKPLTAHLALQLCAEGVLDLDSPLASHLPDDSPPGVHPEDPRWQHIALRHVLSHTSGLSHSDPPVILTPPGERFRYCLGGFALLQKVLEHRTGLDFESLVAERIFRPFGMSHSSFLPPQGSDEQIAHGHDAQGRPLPPAKTPRPRAWNSLWTSADDYARFLARISGDGTSGQFELLWQTIIQPQAEIHDALSWTLGWGLQEGLNGPILWHWGGPSGGRHYVAFSPIHRFGLVLLVNGAAGDTLWPQVVDAAMGGHHPILPWAGSLWSRVERQRELAKVEELQHRHEAFTATLGRTLSEQSGTEWRVEASFTELAPYSECVLMASRFATCVAPLKLGPQKLDAALNLPIAVLRGLLGETDPASAMRRPTDAELRQLEPIAARIARDLAMAWGPEAAMLDRVELEPDPRSVALFEANDPILLLGFRIVAAATVPAGTAAPEAAPAKAKPAKAKPAEAKPANRRYQLAFTVGYPLDRL